MKEPKFKDLLPADKYIFATQITAIGEGKSLTATNSTGITPKQREEEQIKTAVIDLFRKSGELCSKIKRGIAIVNLKEMKLVAEGK